jgi:hypothetical protein
MKDSVPLSARPLARLIRKHVPRPDNLPKPTGYTSINLRWNGSYRGNDCNTCPGGLLPGAVDPEPEVASDLGPLGKHISQEQLVNFVLWWDCECDSEDAVDALWPKEKLLNEPLVETL